MLSAIDSSTDPHRVGELGVAPRPAAEQQLEGGALLGDEREVGEEAGPDLLARVRRLRGRLADRVAEPAADVFEQLEV